MTNDNIIPFGPHLALKRHRKTAILLTRLSQNFHQLSRKERKAILAEVDQVINPKQ